MANRSDAGRDRGQVETAGHLHTQGRNAAVQPDRGPGPAPDHPEDADQRAPRAGKRRAPHPESVRTGPAESGVHAHGNGTVPDPDPG